MSDEHEEVCEACEGTKERLCPECEGRELFEDRWSYSMDCHYTVDVTCQHCEGAHVVYCRDC